MKSKKSLIIQALIILKKYSDVKHPLSIGEIQDLIVKEFNTEPPCRQVISEYIKILNELDIQISENKRKYYYDNHIFDPEQVKLLCHLVISSHAIPTKYTNDLLKQLIKTQSDYFVSNKSFKFNIFNIDKRENKDLFLNIETISDAIDKDVYVSFEYIRYNYLKQLVKVRDKRYKVFPVGIVSSQNRFYLIGYSFKYNKYIHYRIDKIKNIRFEEAVRNKPKTLDPYEYTKHRLYMYSGDINRYEIIVDELMIDELIDLFGLDILIQKINNDEYRAYVKTTETAIKYFALQYVKHVKIISPKSVRNDIKKILEDSLENYKEGV